jgi:hypothetical protein
MWRRISRKGAACAAALAILVPLLALADARTDRLVELLGRSGNYRVRVQSAQSLGRIRDPDTVPALVRALSDDHPAVRAAAAQSLGRIGSPDALSPLRRLADDSGQPAEVRRQARSAVDQIRRMSRMSGGGPRKSSGGGGGSAPSGGGKVRFYVGVGDMGNTTGRRSGELEKTLKQLVRRELGREGHIDVAPDGESVRQTKRVLAARKLSGYYVQGSVTRLEKVGGQIQAVVSIMVLTNPDRNLRMMLQGRGSAATRGGSMSGGVERELEDSALEAAVKGAVSRLASQLRAQ